MPTPLATRIIIGVSAGLLFVLTLVLDAPADHTWLKYLGTVTSVVVALLLLFDRWAWRWLPAGLSKRPDLQGTWRSQLHYQWPDGAATQTKDCFIVIRQTYSTIAVNMHFDISDSHSKSAALIQNNGQHQLWWSYLS